MTPTSATELDQLIDPVDRPVDDVATRRGAAVRLGLDPASYYRVVAVPASHPLAGMSAVTVTIAGNVRVAVRALDAPLPTTRAGIGIATQPHLLSRSATSAILALRLTSRLDPVLRADALGSMLILAEAADAAPHDQSDLAALKFLLRSQPRALLVLEALAATANLRAVATETGLHIDTVRERARDYLRALGFDVLTSRGRTRLAIALALFRLQTNRFS